MADTRYMLDHFKIIQKRKELRKAKKIEQKRRKEAEGNSIS